MAETERKKLPTGVIIGIVAGVAGAAAAGIYAATRAAAQTPPEPEPGLANLYGKVTDAETGKAIPDVLVKLNGLQTYTDSSGYYAFTNIEPGQYSLEFSKEGYETLVY